jgi:hypothetical protein
VVFNGIRVHGVYFPVVPSIDYQAVGEMGGVEFIPILEMKLCPKCVGERYVCCDLCLHFKFNGDKMGRYTGDGWCKLRKEPSDPAEVCDDFHCGDLKPKKKKQQQEKSK